MNKLLKSKKHGSAMVLVVLVLVILSIMGVGLLGLGLNSRLSAVRDAFEIQAKAAANAGLEKAVYEMNQKLKVKPWSDSPLPTETDCAIQGTSETYSFKVTGNSYAGYIVESTGKVGRVEKTIVASLILQGPFDYAILGEDSVSLKGSATADGYNFTDDDCPLKVSTCSTESGAIDLKNFSYINGDVIVGVDGDPQIVIKDNGASITGNKYPATEEVILSSVIVPDWLASETSKGDIEDPVTITNSGKYNKIDIKQDDVVKIDGAVCLYIIGNVILENSAQLQIANSNPDACLVLYIGGDYEGKNSSSINNTTKDATKLKIYGLDTSGKMTFKNSSEFYGAIYAPKAAVTFDNSADAYGAVVAKSFEQKNSASFYYDAALRDADADDQNVRFVIKKWYEK